MTVKIVLGFLLSLATTLLIGPVLIPFLRKLKFGQYIREEGPSWHRSKSGTPTMGGIIFVFGIVVGTICFCMQDLRTMMVLYLALAFGLIGFIDDYIKVVLKRNMGLTEKQKLMMQFLAAGLFILVMQGFGLISTSISIPFAGAKWALSGWFFPFAILFIIGEVNAVNFADGLDGLCSGISLIVAIFFALAGVMLGMGYLAVFAATVAGGMAGFLFFNKYPAKVFMGDTGSMFIGGAFSALAVAGDAIILFLIAGGIYIIEMLSVVLQVISFKTTGKRIFKMSPIHHHFEMCGYSEVKIVTIFSVVTALLCLIAWLGILI